MDPITRREVAALQSRIAAIDAQLGDGSPYIKRPPITRPGQRHAVLFEMHEAPKGAVRDAMLRERASYQAALDARLDQAD
jgi:hypothetical protein